MVWNSFHACLPCFYLSLIAQTCPNLPKIAFTLFFHCLNKKMWLQKVLALLSLALVISLSQCTGVCWEVALEPIELPFILSGVCSPSEANYCSNPFEVLLYKSTFWSKNWKTIKNIKNAVLLFGWIEYPSQKHMKFKSNWIWIFLTDRLYGNQFFGFLIYSVIFVYPHVC